MSEGFGGTDVALKNWPRDMGQQSLAPPPPAAKEPPVVAKPTWSPHVDPWLTIPFDPRLLERGLLTPPTGPHMGPEGFGLYGTSIRGEELRRSRATPAGIVARYRASSRHRPGIRGDQWVYREAQGIIG